MPQGSVSAIYLHPPGSGPMFAAEEVVAEPGLGLRGDTYHGPTTNPDQEITLIETEAVEYLVNEEGVPFSVSEARRNVVTSGVDLNPLVGREFRVGAARLRGIRLCEPCAHLQRLTRPGVLKGLVHRGGLRAQIVEGGTIRVGDPVIVAESPATVA